jgi:solute carrier family 25, member 33/36
MCLFRAVYFATYENSKSILLINGIIDDCSGLHFTSAAIGGFVAVNVTNPIWFIKTRLQLDKSVKGLTIIEAIKKVYNAKGPLGFYKGVTASYFGIIETAIHFSIYERLKYLMNASKDQNESDNSFSSFLKIFLSACISKSFAGTLCYPHGKLNLSKYFN